MPPTAATVTLWLATATGYQTTIELNSAGVRASYRHYDEDDGWVSVEELKKRWRREIIERWLAGRHLAGWGAPAPQRARAEAPPKTRTEWGMVHRERCVHRMGGN